MRLSNWAWSIAWAAALSPSSAAAQLQADDVVQFFPTSARFVAERNEWVLPVHGWIYQPQEDSLVRAAALDGLRRLLDLKPAPDEAPLFKARAWPFVVDNQRDREISVQLGSRCCFLEPSEANGHAHGEIRLPAGEASALLKTPAADGRWLLYSALTGEGDDRLLAGKIELLAPRGNSVISDIDDTIRVSQVRDRHALLENTFLRRFEAVPGMAALYRNWAKSGAAFHYVSAGPWQLYPPLEQFRIAEKFPAGSFALQLFRWKDSSALNFLSKPDDLKRSAIEALLAAFPQRQFTCVGDSGERDPELYADLARRHPGQIERILIRNLSDESPDDARFRTAFREFPRERWRLFADPRELADIKLDPPPAKPAGR